MINDEDMENGANAMELNAFHLEQGGESLKTIRRKWKHRRSRSTSNLLNHTQGASNKITDSDDDEVNKDKIDSDDAERSLAKLTLQSNPRNSKFFPHSSRATIVESDSFNDLFGSTTHGKNSQGRRRRRHKRIAVDESVSMNDEASATGIMAPPEIPKEFMNDEKKLAVAADGKRKRTQREKAIIQALQPTTKGGSYPFSSRFLSEPPFQSSSQDFMNVDLMSMASELMDEDMKSDDDSSLSSNSDDIHPSCDEGREGDDEHSDWVGDEWMEDLDSERRRNLILSRIRDYTPSREIRAGRRRVHPNKPPVFSIRTSYNEQLSKFLQNPDELQLTLHPLEREEISQLAHLASLYSLQLTSVKDDQGLNCHILMKTPRTTQMNGKDFKTTPSPIVSESDTKRVKV